MDAQDIIAACRVHGAKTLHDAAVAAMEGRRSALLALGYAHLGLGDLHAIMSEAYRLMSDEDQAADLAGASIKAASITAPDGAPRPPPDHDL